MARVPHPALVILATLLMGGTASANPTARLVWTGTTGSGTTGSDTIEALPGDVLTLDLLIQTSPTGLSGWDLLMTPADLIVLSSQDCPSPPNTTPGQCDIPGFDFPLIAPSPDLHFVAATTTPFAGEALQPFTVGRAVFAAGSGGQVTLSGLLADATFATVPAGYQAFVVPEPNTIALLSGGLAAIAGARRRTR